MIGQINFLRQRYAQFRVCIGSRSVVRSSIGGRLLMGAAWVGYRNKNRSGIKSPVLNRAYTLPLQEGLQGAESGRCRNFHWRVGPASGANGPCPAYAFWDSRRRCAQRPPVVSITYAPFTAIFDRLRRIFTLSLPSTC